MPIELRWLASTAASCLHAAEALLRGAPLADRAAAAGLADEAAGLADELAAMGLDAGAFFGHAVPLAARFDVPLEWAKAVVSKLAGPQRQEQLAQPLARRFITLQSTFSAIFPGALAELELRAGPLMEQWEARGAGLMAGVGRLTEGELVVETADTILVQPVLGGGGAAHWLYNSVRIEAVLANPLAELPEVARLGWLVAQLQLDLPRYQGDLHRDQLIEVWPLAMIPPVLAAAEEVELARNTPQVLDTALSAWVSNPPAGAVDTLTGWWETYCDAQPPWPVALGALAQMLAGE
ncbi:MAG: hypothetical protein AB7O59_14405 [Pirellulales bacterium]